MRLPLSHKDTKGHKEPGMLKEHFVKLSALVPLWREKYYSSCNQIRIIVELKLIIY